MTRPSLGYAQPSVKWLHDFHFCPRSYNRAECWCYWLKHRNTELELEMRTQRYERESQLGYNFRHDNPHKKG